MHDLGVMRIRSIIATCAMFCLAFAGCGEKEDIVEDQRNDIVRYLTSSHNPRLIAQEDVANSIESQPHFYERLNQNLYRYIATYYDEGREALPQVEMGDKVSLVFMAAAFEGSAPALNQVYLTNDANVLSQLAQAGLNTTYWSSEPLVVELGHTKIIDGVVESLVGCRLGDQVEAYMTLEAAYDKEVLGVVPKDSAVVWIYVITDVVKK